MGHKFLTSLTFLLSFLILSSHIANAQPAPDLFFSEYIEGGSYNKALEIYNPTGNAVDLNGYKIERYANGLSTASDIITLPSYSLVSGSVFVICHPSFVSPQICNLTSGNIQHNGDDAIALKNPANEYLDVIGQIGVDPDGNPDVTGEWGLGLTSTKDNTLVRKCDITHGDTNGSDVFEPAIEWDGYPMDTFAHLGSHAICLPVCGNGVIETGEVCDTNSQSCTTESGYSGSQSCNQTCDGWNICQTTESCGDGQINGPEQCDNGGQNGIACTPEYGSTCDYCDSSCQTQTVNGPYCGDGIINGSEQCDDGNKVSGDGCSDTCQIEILKEGSLSGFCFYDRDKDNAWDGWRKHEFKTNGWKIFLDENTNSRYDRGEKFVFTRGFSSFLPLGKFSFTQLMPGSYRVCEFVFLGFQSSLPDHANCLSITLGSGEDKTEINFGNYLKRDIINGGT